MGHSECLLRQKALSLKNLICSNCGCHEAIFDVFLSLFVVIFMRIVTINFVAWMFLFSLEPRCELQLHSDDHDDDDDDDGSCSDR